MRAEVPLYVYEADNSWRRQPLAMIQSTQQMASVWLTAAITSLQKHSHDVGILAQLLYIHHPRQDSVIHSAIFRRGSFKEVYPDCVAFVG